MTQFREYFVANFAASVDATSAMSEVENQLRKRLLETSSNFIKHLTYTVRQELSEVFRDRHQDIASNQAMKWLKGIVEKSDSAGRTFLHCAVAIGHATAAQYLTPIDYAALCFDAKLLCQLVYFEGRFRTYVKWIPQLVAIMEIITTRPETT